MQAVTWNDNWRFEEEGHPQNGQVLTLPHDAMIGRKRIPRLKNGSLTGYYPSKDSDYYKCFFADERYREKAVLLEFEGVYMDSTVYLNGEKVGGRVYGYSNFFVDLTDRLKLLAENEIRVHTHCSQVPNSRWYPGNGIYRPVRMYVGEKTHILPDGIRVNTISHDPAVIEVRTETTAAADQYLRYRIYDRDKLIGEQKAGGTETVTIELGSARCWSSENPYLYTLRAELCEEDRIIDTAAVEFGIHQIELVPGRGLVLNGVSVKLRGGCIHHDFGLLGAAEYREAAFRRIRLLKDAGFNAVRSAHNPLDKDTLAACDQLGMYVLDEAFDSWEENAGTYGYVLDFREEWQKDIASMVRKDWSHPSVIMYSIGNEISDTAKPAGVEWTKRIREAVRELDDFRPVTVCPNVMMNVLAQKGMQASLNAGDFKKTDVTDPEECDRDSKMGGSVLINILMATAPILSGLFMKPKAADAATIGCYSNVDIAGYNYGHKVYEEHLKMHPDRLIVGSETQSPAIAENWALVMKNPNVIGDFMWTAWDYLGEAGVGCVDYGKNEGNYNKPYPCISAYTGAFDLSGHKDTIGHLASIVWGTETNPYIAVKPVCHAKEKAYISQYRGTDAIPCWTYPGYEGTGAVIEVYSCGETVELRQNGKSLGKKKLKGRKAVFKTTYEPGELTAISYGSDGRRLAHSRLKTAGSESMLTVACSKTDLKADAGDLCFIDISLTDPEGILKMTDEEEIRVRVEGCGSLAAIGSADPRAKEPYCGAQTTLYQGRAQAIIRSGSEAGTIRVHISSQTHGDQELTLNVTED